MTLVQLSFPNASSTFFEGLNQLPAGLQSLSLVGSPVTCAHLDVLKDFRQMGFVNLQQTHVSDECVDDLRKLRHITHIDIRNSDVSPDIAATFVIGGN